MTALPRRKISPSILVTCRNKMAHRPQRRVRSAFTKTTKKQGAARKGQTGGGVRSTWHGRVAGTQARERSRTHRGNHGPFAGSGRSSPGTSSDFRPGGARWPSRRFDPVAIRPLSCRLQQRACDGLAPSSVFRGVRTKSRSLPPDCQVKIYNTSIQLTFFARVSLPRPSDGRCSPCASRPPGRPRPRSPAPGRTRRPTRR